MNSRLRTIALGAALVLAGTFAALYLVERRQRIEAQFRVEELLGTLAKRDAIRSRPQETPPVLHRRPFGRKPDGGIESMSHDSGRRPGLIDAPGPGYRGQLEKTAPTP